MEDGFSFQTGDKRPLQILDYVLFSLLFVVSSAIGFYHAYRWRNKESEYEFHFAGRSLHPVPVSLSLAATYFSALTILGVPAEIYTNNTMFMWAIVPSFLSTILVAHLFAPFFHQLQLTSCYEYIEKRFCRPLRFVASGIFILSSTLFLGIVLYLPCLALQAVTDVSLWYTMAVVCVVCIFYTVLGGMRSVIWVDSLQFLVIVAGLIAAFVGGSKATGGIQNAWKIAHERGRIQFDEISPDPRTRHSVWSITIGYLTLLTYTYGLSQLQIQRVCTLSTPRKIKIAVWLSFPMYVIVQVLVCMTGVVMFAFYSDCHPVSYGLINKNDQLLPLFVLDVLGKVPGMPGLFIACIFSACLSTISSCLNTISTAILEDFVKMFCCRKFALRNGVKFSRFLVFLVGCIMFILAILTSQMTQLILQFGTSVHGMLVGPLIGVFICGIFLPWTNSKGATVGMLVSFVFMVWLVLGSMIESPPGTPPLPTSTDGCNWNASSTLKLIDISLATAPNNTAYTIVSNTTGSESSDEPWIYNFYRISYMWYSPLGALISIIFTVVGSFVTGANDPAQMDSRLICPVFDVLFPWLPERIRRPLRFGVVHKPKAVSDELKIDHLADETVIIQPNGSAGVTN